MRLKKVGFQEQASAINTISCAVNRHREQDGDLRRLQNRSRL